MSTQPDRIISVTIIERLRTGDTIVLRETLHRCGGATRWHVIHSLDEVLDILRERPMSKLEFYELGSLLTSLSAPGGSY